MEPLVLKPRQPVKEDIECWDDDDDLQGIDDLQFRNISSTTVGTQSSAQASHHRDSISSRLSTRSDVDSNGGGDEDWQVLLPTNDETSTSKAIASAKIAGVPIPANVPTSALLGGTIKRLGGRRLKKVFGDDWSDDLEMPKLGEGGLRLKKIDTQEFPDALRQISLAFSNSPSPAKSQVNLTFVERLQSSAKAPATIAAMGKFRDDDDDFDDFPTIKIAKSRSPQKPLVLTPSPVKHSKASKEAESFEDDFELPSEDQPLKLSARKEIPKTPASQLHDDADAEWAEGSQGSLSTKPGVARRSNRSSSISALSPSVFSPSLSSCLTAESEDEGLEGLILPDGPLKFQEALTKRKEIVLPESLDPPAEKQAEKITFSKEDFFSGIEIGDGDVFDSGKLTLNRNIKHKATRQTSPVRRTAMTLTFTDKPQAANTRIPKPQQHERTRSRLEPVSESGGPIPNFRRSQSRVGGHSAQSSISNIPAPSATSFPHNTGPSTPSRRGLNSKPSRENLRADPTTTSAQLLKAKRSMPALKHMPSPCRTQPSYQRPPSRSEHNSRPTNISRPKTPTDRLGAESSLGNARKLLVPFLPAGSVPAQSHHINTKSNRNYHRPQSSDSNENVPLNRPISRLSNPHYRPNTPTGRRDVAPESLTREAASKRTLTKPTRRRAFGDGTELEIFDDLPTSASVESKFVKQSVGRGNLKSTNLRNKLSASQNASTTSLSKLDSAPQTPLSPLRSGANIPRFARDTAASRLAREQRTGTVNSQPLRGVNNADLHTPLAPLSTNWKSHVTSKPLASPRPRKLNIKPQIKPHLIKPMGDAVLQPKSEKGMHWNPQSFRWEGNENALATFDVAVSGPDSPRSGGTGTLTKPALIANVGSIKGVQVVGGMVFDPQRMCWLKMAPNSFSARNRSEGGAMSPDTADDEDDPFAGLDDLDDGKGSKKGDGFGGSESRHGKEGVVGGLADDEWLV
ncbi:MAG: hypothetical protein Q9187_002322, partial [Circinaria calcarea]